MAKRKDFNKGLVKGVVSKCNLVEYVNKATQEKNNFLSMEINTGSSNKIKATAFNTISNPTKAKELVEQFPVGKVVEISGTVSEREFESKSGKLCVDRSVNIFTIKDYDSEGKRNATFVLQGIVKRIKETTDGGALVTLTIDNSYTKKDGTKVEREEQFGLIADEQAYEIMEDLDVYKGCNVKFKGVMLDKFEMDDYGDIISSIQMLKIEKVEEVIDADDVEEPEELSFL